MPVRPAEFLLPPPLYRALEERGWLVKTEFLPRYVNQVELRQRSQK